MKLMIVGQRWLGAELLAQCVADGHEVMGVSTPPGDGDEYDRLYARAQQLGIHAAVHQRRITASDVPTGCDVILAAHAHAFIDASARHATRFGALGYHPSLLPRHRGRDAIRWALHMREPITGGTIYWMDDGADTGPIARQDWCHVRPDDTPSTLWRRELAPMGLRLFRAVLEDFSKGMVRSARQDDALATWEPAFIARRLMADP